MDETSSAEAAATAASLPEDVVREIFVRVEDPAALFRCAVTSKRWIRLVADSSFIRRRWPDQGSCSTRTSSSFLAGFVTQKQVDHRTRLETSFIPTSRSFGTGRRRLGSLFPDAESLLDHAVPLAARHGLLLVRLSLPRLAIVHLAVCDLIAGACHVLPLLIHSSEVPKSGYAILTDADCCSSTEQQLQSSSGYSSFYKVVVLGVKWSGRPENLHTFSSSEARWSTPQTLLFDSSQIVLSGLPRHHDGVVCRGTVHWLVGDWSNAGSTNLYTLGVDLETCRLSWTNVPDTLNYCSSLSYDEPQLKVAADGVLSLLVLHRPGLQLQIYTRHDSKIIEDTASDGWICTDVIELKPPEQIQRRPMHVSIHASAAGRS